MRDLISAPSVIKYLLPREIWKITRKGTLKTSIFINLKNIIDHTNAHKLDAQKNTIESMSYTTMLRSSIPYRKCRKSSSWKRSLLSLFCTCLQFGNSINLPKLIVSNLNLKSLSWMNKQLRCLYNRNKKTPHSCDSFKAQ